MSICLQCVREHVLMRMRGFAALDTDVSVCNWIGVIVWTEINVACLWCSILGRMFQLGCWI